MFQKRQTLAGIRGTPHSPHVSRSFFYAIALAAFFCFAGNAWSLTLTQIQDQVRRATRDTQTDTDLQRYSNALITDWANEAQRDFFNATWCVKTSTSIVLSSGTIYYDLPTDYVAVDYVLFTDNNGLDFDLKEESEKKVIQSEGDYENTSTGTPDRYVVRYSTSGGNSFQVAFLPYPVTNTSTGTARVSYFQQPAALSASSDVPFEGHLPLVQYHDALVYFVTARIKAIEGLTVEAEFYFNLYERAVIAARNRLNSMPNYNPSLRGAPR